MYEKFGELTLEEFNNMAEGFKNEGDIESLKALAGEYQIDQFDTQDYITGDIGQLATNIAFALGKLQSEYEDKLSKSKTTWDILPFKTVYDMSVSMIDKIADYICADKEKKLEDIVSEMKKIAQKNASNGIACVCGTDKQLRDIIMAYYSKNIKAAEKIIKALGDKKNAGI